MKDLLTKISSRLNVGSYVNEAAVRIGIIEPILSSLGWDITDPVSVQPEYSSQGRRVDYALCAYPARPCVFVEAKAVGKVEAADRQLFEYAFHEGVPFAVLTDGRTWSFYLPSAQGSYEDRRLHKLDLQERTPDECERIFIRYLSFERLRRGDAQSDAQTDYANRANERLAGDTLGRAWSELTNEPDPLLIDLLVERTEALCGLRPSLEAAEAFLLQHKSANLPTVTQAPLFQSRSPGTLQVPQPFSEQTQEPARHSRRVTAVFRGRDLAAKDATTGFLELLRLLARDFPSHLPQMAAAAKGRSRNHIARTREEVYPDKPELLHTVVELVPGWYVGTNVANREKYRIVKAACDACGVRFGTDLTFELPNT